MKIHYFKLDIIDEEHAKIPLMMPIQKREIQEKHQIVTLTFENGQWSTSQVMSGEKFVTTKPTTKPQQKTVW